MRENEKFQKFIKLKKIIIIKELEGKIYVIYPIVNVEGKHMKNNHCLFKIMY